MIRASRPSPEEAAAAATARLAELEALAHELARGLLPTRGHATRYSAARDALLASPVASLLPGFLYQCLSVHRLRDFITLYDPEAELRGRFLTRAFAASRAAIGESVAKPTRTGTSGWSL